MKKLLFFIIGIVSINLSLAQQAYYERIEYLNTFLNTGFGFELLLFFFILFALSFVLVKRFFPGAKQNVTVTIIALSISLLAIGFLTQELFDMLFVTYQTFGIVTAYLLTSLIFLLFIYFISLPPLFRKVLLILYGVTLMFVPLYGITHTFSLNVLRIVVPVGVIIALFFDSKLEKYTQRFKS